MVQTNGLKKIVIIAGPTGSGKTALSLKCAQKLDCEIIGCDSMQIYRRMNIGTGKVPKSLQIVPHHMIDIVEPNDEFSVNEYVKQTSEIIDEITKRKKVPIIVGGTGLYIMGLVKGLDYAGAGKSNTIRNKYLKLLSETSPEYIHGILKNTDKESADRINPNDTKRIIRALEIFELTGIPKSQSFTASKPPLYDYAMIVLSPDRQILYANINNRVLEMIDEGLIEEVRSLQHYRNCQSMQAIGYKEILAYLNGDIKLDEAVERIQINSRHYAKRQLTYFRRADLQATMYENYIPENDDDNILSDIEKFIL